MSERERFGGAPRPKRYWWRFLLATILIVTTSATATATAGLNLLTPPPSIEDVPLDPGAPGEPRTFLILGVDRRAGAALEGDPGRSDTAVLLRVDPEGGSTSVMSVPRDLKVEIPGHGTDKFNAAYAYGGPKLTLRTVKRLTGLKVNHIISVDFLGFAQAVYAIGCVYVDVDRRYYHSNEGVPPDQQYAEIDIQPGYQLMCGKKALDYVRYRHTDTDLVRSARQQDFLGAARGRLGADDLLLDEDGLHSILAENTRSDIDDRATLIRVLRLFYGVRDGGLRQIEFPAEAGPSYVTTTPKRVDEAVSEFLGRPGPKAVPGERKVKKGGRGERQPGKASTRRGGTQAPRSGGDGLVAAREAGAEEAEIAADELREPFPVFYPTRLPEGAHYAVTDPLEAVVDPHIYRVKDGLGPDADRFAAYRMVIVAELDDGPHYFGVQGIRGWSDPPILDNPSLTKTINGRDYDIYVDGDRIRLVAWHRGENSYWIANDLLRSLTNDQMVGMARSVAAIEPKTKPGA